MDRRFIAIIGFGLLACIAGGWLLEVPENGPGAATQRKSAKANSESTIQQVGYQQEAGQNPTAWPSRYPLVPAEAAEMASKLTEEEVKVLGQLPPVCTSDLPGLDHSPRQQQPYQAHSQDFQPTNVAQSGFRQPAYPQANGSIQHSSLPAQQPAFSNPQQSGFTVLPGEKIPATGSGQTWTSQVSGQETFNSAINSGYQEPIQTSGQRVAHRSGMPNPHANVAMSSPAPRTDGVDPHLEIYSRNAFPSAEECATCHQQIYDEWASSSHAYASVSPMFHRFENTINKLAQGTVGYFCLRCHAPVATTMGLRRDQAIWDGPKVFREGVTCVACHRVKTPYGKANGERRIEPGPVTDPVYGGTDGQGVATAIKYNEFYKTKVDPDSKAPGQLIHRRSIQFEELSESTFCMSCHQVAVQPGIKLEVVWDQYRASPAFRQGITCQDCHMGIEPGVAEGYSFGPAAVVNDKVVNPERKHSNHMFYGPGYSIAHPGIFPHTKDSNRWKFNDWLLFDWRAGWGTDEFEDALAAGKFHASFPPVWDDPDDRYDAREIVDANLKKLKYKKDIRRQLMENGSKVDGPFFARDPQVGRPLKFRYCVTNTNPGHNMPSGSLGAQPQVWLNTVLIGPSGEPLWESGYLDSNGDLADLHSLDVVSRRIPLDKQLFNLQTKFLTTNVKGTDREMYLPVNVDIDQLPFLRPPAQPVTVINHPPAIRMEAHSIPPLGSKNAKYVVPGHVIKEPGIYRLSVRMRSRAEPIYFMRFCESTPEMERMMNEWICDFHEHSVTFEVK